MMSNDEIKVLFVTASTHGGGAERMLFNIIRSMDERHICKLLITSTDKVSDDSIGNVDVLNANKAHAIEAFPFLVKILKSFRPKHVFTTSSNVGYMIILAKKILRADFKIYIRCAVSPSEIYSHDIKSKLLEKIIRYCYKSADLIIAQTDFMRQDLISNYNLDPNRVRTIRNIVDIPYIQTLAENSDSLDMDKGAYKILAAGALYSVKGFDVLIEAISPLIIGSDKHLYIIGEERYESGYKDFLLSKINTLGLTPNVHILGHKTNPYPYFKSADLFVLSSRKEGYPNVVLEAMALGKPVVATDVVDWSGVIEVGTNGFISKKDDVISLRNALREAFKKKFEISNTHLVNYNYNELFD